MFSLLKYAHKGFLPKYLFDVDSAPSDIVAILMGKVLGNVGNEIVAAF